MRVACSRSTLKIYEDVDRETMRTVDEMHMSPADVLTTAEQDVFGNFQPEKTGKNFSLEKV